MSTPSWITSDGLLTFEADLVMARECPIDTLDSQDPEELASWLQQRFGLTEEQAMRNALGQQFVVK